MHSIDFPTGRDLISAGHEKLGVKQSQQLTRVCCNEHLISTSECEINQRFVLLNNSNS